MSNLDYKLARLKRHIVSGQSSPSAGPPSAKIPPRYQKLADAVGGSLIESYGGCFVEVVWQFRWGEAFGDITVEAPPSSSHLPFSSFRPHEDEGTAAFDNLLFVDLETTGLGGAGTVPFLIGYGRVTAEAFEVHQLLLPDYSDETAALEHLVAQIDSGDVYVTYNGAAFDLPVLTDRLVINRVARSLPDRRQIDLLHASRRLYKRRLKDCSLVNIEREIFGFFREDDIPGYLIPAVFFDWVSSDDIGYLPQVLIHNQFDILTMYALLTRLNEVYLSEGDTLTHADDLYSLSRVYGRRRQNKRVMKMHERLEAEGQDNDPEYLWYHSLAYKREGRWSEAVGLWERLSETLDSHANERAAFQAAVELAKYHEHRARDLTRALEYARAARFLCPSVKSCREDCRRRLERLNRKLA